jgi:hypothetical protein
MKVPVPNMVRCNLRLRSDVRDAMEALRDRWQEDGTYVSLGRVFSEAAKMLLRREGMSLDDDPMPTRKMALRAKPPKTERRRQALGA